MAKTSCHCRSPIAELDFKAAFGTMACFLEWKPAPFGCRPRPMEFKMTNAVIAADTSRPTTSYPRWQNNHRCRHVDTIDNVSSSGLFLINKT